MALTRPFFDMGKEGEKARLRAKVEKILFAPSRHCAPEWRIFGKKLTG
jgi:hypothetical protein